MAYKSVKKLMVKLGLSIFCYIEFKFVTILKDSTNGNSCRFSFFIVNLLTTMNGVILKWKNKIVRSNVLWWQIQS